MAHTRRAPQDKPPTPRTCIGSLGCGAVLTSDERGNTIGHLPDCKWKARSDAYNADLRERLARVDERTAASKASKASKTESARPRSTGPRPTRTSRAGNRKDKTMTMTDIVIRGEDGDALRKSKDPKERVMAMSRAELRDILQDAGVAGAQNLRRPEAEKLYLEFVRVGKAKMRDYAISVSSSGEVHRGGATKKAAATKQPAKKAAATKKAPAKKAAAAKKAPAKKAA